MLKGCVVGIIVLGISCSVAAGQTRNVAKKKTLPDFDIRESTIAATTSSADSESRAIVERRAAALTAFARRPEEAGLGTRITPTRYGMPKLYLRDGHSLSAPSSLSAAEIAKDLLRSRADIFPMTPAEIDGLRLLVDDATDSARFVAFNQTVNGIDVFNGQIKFTLNPGGEIIQVATGDVVPGLNVSPTPRLTPENAVRAGFAGIGSALTTALSVMPGSGNKTSFANPLGGRYSAITAELTVFPMSASSARLAYHVFLEVDQKSWYELLIDAETGAVLLRHNLYVSSFQANVWTQSPSVGTRSIVAFPDGWLPANGTVTTGNNVDAYLDAHGDDQPDNVTNVSMQAGRALSTNQVFNFPFGDGTVQLDPRGYQPAAVTNLFYFVNVAHDYYYSLGFDEAAGNFQTDNMGRGGVGNDPVLAEAQFGGFVNDSDFSPTPEGMSPKMRIGIFTQNTSSPTDDLDGDYDGQTIVHEYGHGVSNRLVGAKTSTTCLTNIQSGAMGEGWSDYFAISYFNNPVFGGYISQNFVSGVRRYSYEGYPLTYEDIGTGIYGYEVHDDGEIWAGTLWDLRKSLGQGTTDRLVLDGLKATPCLPSMTDARDGILSADQADNNGANRKMIWTIFAKHGMGFSAAGIDGTVFTGTQYDAAYDLPPDLQPNQNPMITSNPLTIQTGDGQLYNYAVTASDPSGGTLNFALSSGPAGMTVDASSGFVSWTAGFVSQRVKITVTDGQGGKVVHGYLLPIITQLNSGVSVTITADQYSTGLARITVPPNTPILQITMRYGTGDPNMFVYSPSGLLSISADDGPTQTLSFPNPEPGLWQIEGYGYESYSGVLLTASFITPPLLHPNSPLTNLNGVLDGETFYRISVPSDASTLVITTSGGTGDVDLFLKKGSPPTCPESFNVFAACVFDKFSVNEGNQESITVNQPTPTDWYLDLVGYESYAGVTLNVAITFPALTLASGGVVGTSTPDTGTTTNSGYATANLGYECSACFTVPYATAVFSFTENGTVVSETGVPASPPTSSARIFIDYRTGVSSGTGSLNIDTGLAIANIGSSAAHLTFTLRDASGSSLSVGHGTLAAGAHRAIFIDQLNTLAPDFNLSPTFSTNTLFGSLQIDSDQTVSILALRLTINQRGDTLITSTPGADLTEAPSSSPVYFPQLADGGGFTTSVILLNTTGTTETGTISLFADNGSALSLRPVGGSSASSFSYSIPASGFFVLQTDGSPTSTQAGWVEVNPAAGTNSPVGAGIFSYSPQGILVTESGISSAQPTTKARLYVDLSNGHDTGIAIANPGSSSLNVAIQAYTTDGLTSVGNAPPPLVLSASGHSAAFADQWISALPANFTGIAEITSSSPFLALTLRSLTNSRGDTLLTTFPVADENTFQTAPLTIVFPQIADGGGFATQFIFIARAPNNTASVNLSFFADDGSTLNVGRNP